MKFTRTTLALGTVAALGFGSAGTALADTYGYSQLRAYELNTLFACNGDAMDQSCIELNTYNSDSTSRAATLPGGSAVPGFDAASGIPPNKDPDALAAEVNIGVGENNFTQAGGMAGDYARADSQIVSQQISGIFGVNTEVNGVAEGNLVDRFTSSAGGTTSSGTQLEVTFTTTGDFTLSLSLLADWRLESFADPGDGPATVTSNFSLELKQGGATLFELTPTELNQSFTDDDTSDGMSSVNAGAGVAFNDTSASFGAGTYSLAYSHGVSILLTNVPEIPSPATLALLGVGLAGLGFGKRRRQKVAA